MQLRSRFFLASASALLCALLATTAHAAEPSATEVAVARRLFSEASALQQEQKWAAAAQKLREAIAIKDTPGLRFHLARCEEEQGQLVEASLDYERAAELIERGAQAPDVAKLLPDARKNVQARIPTITIEVLPPEITNATVSIDGRPLAPTLVGNPAPLNPGRYRVQVSAPGRKAFLQEVTLAEGQQLRLGAALPEDRTKPAAATPTPSTTSSPSGTLLSSPDATVDTSNPNALRTAVIIGEVAVAVVGLAVGIGFKIAESSASSEAEDKREQIDKSIAGTNETPNSACAPREPALPAERVALCEAAESAEQDRSRYSNIATAGFVGAGVGAVAAGLTLLLWPSESEQRAMRFEAVPLHGGFAVGLSGKF